MAENSTGKRPLLLLLLLAPLAFAQLSTQDHVADPGFWPTQGQSSRQNFVGDSTCARCHAKMVASQQLTPMTRTLAPAALAPVLHSSAGLSFQVKDDTYHIRTEGSGTKQQAIYTVRGPSQTLSFPLTWAFGTGRVGQSYLFKSADGAFNEARVTYFARLHALGFTPARALPNPGSVAEAMYRPVPQAEVLRCFNCHATGAEIDGNFDEAHLVPGIHCEACHGPGAAHTADMAVARTTGYSAPDATAQHPIRPDILNPANLTPTEAVEFCGACHGSLWDVKFAHVTGPSSVRSAPYRLVTSRCWGKGEDPRITCTACHDPHQQLQTDPAAYDSACLQCHTTGAQAHPASAKLPSSLPACPVATSKCTTCHMPKVYVSEMNDSFTDHRIRVVRSNTPFPE